MLYVFSVSLLLIAVGELADKSQLLALVLATRYKAWQVLLGIFVATFVVHFFSTAFGQLTGSLVPDGVLHWVSGSLFIFFGLWTLRGDSIDGDQMAGRGSRFGPVLAVAIAFFFAELGDKTQIMTITIAADPGGALLAVLQSAGPAVQDRLASLGLTSVATSGTARFWGVTLGSTVGMVLADGIAIVIGRTLGTRIPQRALSRISAAIFIAFGLFTIVSPYLWS